MVEIGTVQEIDGENAIVKVDKKDECSKCGMCLFPKNASFINFRATNKTGAKVGDVVEIQTAEELKVIGTLLVFLVPLLLIGLSILISYLLIQSEIWILILSVIFIVLWYTILALIDKKLKTLKKFSANITKIIKENEDE